MDLIGFVAVIPVIIVWVVYDRQLSSAIRAEIAGIDEPEGQKIRLSEEFVSRWTTRAVFWYGLSFAAMLAISLGAGFVETPEGSAIVPVALVFLFVVLVGGLSAGAIVQRHIRRHWFSE